MKAKQLVGGWLVLAACGPVDDDRDPDLAHTPDASDPAAVDVPAVGTFDAGTQHPASGVAVSLDVAGREFVVVADGDGQALLVFDPLASPADGPARLALGATPGRVAVVGAHVFATLPFEGEVVHAWWDGAHLQLVDRVVVGVEPSDLAIRPGVAPALVVALQQERVLRVLDPDTLDAERTVDLPFAPRWVAAGLVEGRAVAVSSAQRGEEVLAVDLDDPGERHSALLRATSISSGCEVRTVHPGVSGGGVFVDGAVHVPVVYVDLEVGGRRGDPSGTVSLPADGGDDTDQDVSDTGEVPRDTFAPGDPPRDGRCAGRTTYGGLPSDPGVDPLARFNPAIVRVEIAGLLGGTHAASSVFDVAWIAPRRGFMDVETHGVPADLVLDAPRGRLWTRVRGTGWHVAVDPVSGTALEGPVSLLDVADIDEIAFDLDRAQGPLVVQPSGRMMVWSPGRRVLERVDEEGVDHRLSVGPGLRVYTDVPVGETIPAPDDGVTAAVRRGRQLFERANTGITSAASTGVACASCHPDGRVDGHTWRIDGDARQTPSLVGGVEQTAPYTWIGENPTLEVEVARTFEERMGGVGHSPADHEAVAAFLATLPAIPRPSGTLLTDAGRALFEGDALGCTGCHAGATLQDGRRWSTPRGEIDTPSLRGVGATAPYGKDGRADTLEAFLQARHADDQPEVPRLDDAKKLAAYLDTL